MNSWIQAEFESYFKITGIQTLGREDQDQWVTTYKISYSINGQDWNVFADHNGKEKAS